LLSEELSGLIALERERPLERELDNRPREG